MPTSGASTILRDPAPAPDPHALALAALGWVLADEDRADRLLALTGLAPGDLAARLGEPLVLAEVIDFIARHEPDLIACAEALATTPPALLAARDALAGAPSSTDWGA